MDCGRIDPVSAAWAEYQALTEQMNREYTDVPEARRLELEQVMKGDAPTVAGVAAQVAWVRYELSEGLEATDMHVAVLGRALGRLKAENDTQAAMMMPLAESE